jgi:hypothetical protein
MAKVHRFIRVFGKDEEFNSLYSAEATRSIPNIHKGTQMNLKKFGFQKHVIAFKGASLKKQYVCVHWALD